MWYSTPHLVTIAWLHICDRHMWMLILICMTHFLGTFTKLRKATISFIIPFSLPVCPPSAWNGLASSQIFVKSDILVFFENLSREAKLRYNLTRITGTWHEDQYTFLIISCWILLRMRNVSDIFNFCYQRLWLECR